MEELAGKGIILADTLVPVARSLLGVAVKAGARRPDISSPDAFIHMLTSVDRVAFSQGGASGIYFSGLIERLGIADAVNANAVTIPAGFTAEKIMSGEAEVAIQQISELMSVPGIEIVGPFPDAFQSVVELSAAVFADAANPSEARAFVSALTMPAAAAAYEKGGLTPRISAAADRNAP
jgi:molybdate transport system substrate-binding protein